MYDLFMSTVQAHFTTIELPPVDDEYGVGPPRMRHLHYKQIQGHTGPPILSLHRQSTSPSEPKNIRSQITYPAQLNGIFAKSEIISLNIAPSTHLGYRRDRAR